MELGIRVLRGRNQAADIEQLGFVVDQTLVKEAGLAQSLCYIVGRELVKLA